MTENTDNIMPGKSEGKLIRTLLREKEALESRLNNCAEHCKILESENRQLKELRRQFAMRELGYDPYEDEQNDTDID